MPVAQFGDGMLHEALPALAGAGIEIEGCLEIDLICQIPPRSFAQ